MRRYTWTRNFYFLLNSLATQTPCSLPPLSSHLSRPPSGTAPHSLWSLEFSPPAPPPVFAPLNACQRRLRNFRLFERPTATDCCTMIFTNNWKNNAWTVFREQKIIFQNDSIYDLVLFSYSFVFIGYHFFGAHDDNL